MAILVLGLVPWFGPNGQVWALCHGSDLYGQVWALSHGSNLYGQVLGLEPKSRRVIVWLSWFGRSRHGFGPLLVKFRTVAGQVLGLVPQSGHSLP